MVRFRIAALVAFLGCALAHGADRGSPQRGHVGDGGATVRCGPGDSYYATDELEPGAEVEVWQHAASGWLAIRPPASSFSLVPAASLRRVSGSDVAEVEGDEVVAWIGSRLDHAGDHRWQVQLDRGEKVIVLGTTQLRLHKAAEDEKVVKIAPPAGEFRWIRNRDLQNPLPSKETPPSASPVRLAEYQVAAIDEEKEPVKPSPADGFVPRKVTAPVARAASRSTSPPRPSTAGSERAFETALRDAELQLSLMAAQPASRWDFQALRDEAQSLIDRGETTLDRARAQRLLEQVEDFDALKKRSSLLRGGEPDAAAGPPGGAEAGEAEPLVDPRFDGSGWLFPVYSRQRVAPPYALLDDEGRIVQFISPAPGLNLHRYLRKQIGVYGEKSAAPNVDKPHVVAHRVVDLDRHRR